MRKLTVLVISVFLGMSGWGEEVQWTWLGGYFEEGRVIRVGVGETKIYCSIVPREWGLRSLSSSDDEVRDVWVYKDMVEWGEDGYGYVTVEEVRIRLVWGGGWVMYHPVEEGLGDMYAEGIQVVVEEGGQEVRKRSILLEYAELPPERWEEERGEPDMVWGRFFETGVEVVWSSSHLEEEVRGRLISYSGEGMEELFVVSFMPLSWALWVNGPGIVPWVEGVEGPGIGEKIRVRIKGKRVVGGDMFEGELWRIEGEGEGGDTLVVLNGFVDPRRPHLYKMNNRVKRAVIRSVDGGEPFEVEVEFPDVVKFHVVKLPRLAKEVEFEIREVYKGTKWDDTCVTGIFIPRGPLSFSPNERPWRPAKEVEEWEKSKKKR